MSDLYDSVAIQLPRDRALLERFYNELMIPNFPIADELEPLEAWVDQLNGYSRHPASDGSKQKRNDGLGSADKARCTLNVIVTLDAKSGSAHTSGQPPKLLGGIVFEYYYPSNCALITYLVISPTTRGQGMAVYMTIKAWEVMRATSKRYGHSMPYAVFCECNDPAHISDDQDAFSPLARIRAFQNAGVRPINEFSYIQPALGAGQEKARDMMLAAVVGPMTERDDDGNAFIQSAQILQFLHDFYLELGLQPSTDADFLAMKDNLSKTPRKFLVDFDLSKFKPRVKSQPSSSASSPATTSPSPSPSSAPSNNVYIIVVGAGLSGLECARRLRQSGFRVTVLEARHRIGGRLYTGRTFDTYLDLGAAWFHGLDENPLVEYAQQALPNLKLYKSNEQALVLYDTDGKAIEDSLVMETYMKFMALIETVDREYHATDGEAVKPTGSPVLSTPKSKAASSVSLQDALQRLYEKASKENKYASRKEKLVMNFLFSQLESLQNASMKELCAKDYGYGSQYEGGDNIVVSGFQNIARALAVDLDVRMDMEVVHIEYGKHESANASTPPRVVVRTKRGEALTCNGVLVTVPIGVLHSETIRFTPELPAWKKHSVRAIGAGLFNKVVLHFPHRFWQKGVDYIGASFDPDVVDPAADDLTTAHRQRSNLWFTNLDSVVGQPILVGMVSGDLARRFQTLSDKQIAAHCLRRLRKIYGEQNVPNPIDVVITQWGKDPYSRCSYSFLPVGCTVQDFDNAALPVDDVVFWAGEHTSRERFGYADGAFCSGQREADRIAQVYARYVSSSSAASTAAEKKQKKTKETLPRSRL